MRTRPIALVAAALLALAGCHGDHDDDEHEHAGHIIPAHKPQSFPDAVRRLRELHRRIDLEASEGRGSSRLDDRTMADAIDIATWLPEIAADSDMPERPWDEVNDRAGALLASYRTLAGGDPAARRAADRALAGLEAILARADPHWFDGAAGSGGPP